jgi:pimeloyl-ACP methyl ester carboxylesterase
MEANKIKGPAKSIILPNGAEITYAERGEQNQEVAICGAFYHHTFMPVVEGLAQRYHVYAVVMRFDGVTDQKNPDGSTHWGNQWGKDIYDFAQAMGIQKFHYIGKCHGTIPGWYLFKNHPEVLIDFCSFFLGPHTRPANSNEWVSLLQGHDTSAMMRVALRKPETGLPKKMEEMASIGPNAGGPEVMKYGGYPEMLWDGDVEAIERDLRNAPVPVGYLFGSIDPLFKDHHDSNIRLWELTRGCHFTILQGECHLMELDCPERVVDEAFAFIDQAHKNYD